MKIQSKFGWAILVVLSLVIPFSQVLAEATGGLREPSSPLLVLPTRNADWNVVEFQGPAAATLYSVLLFQGEISCGESQDGTSVCRAWLSKNGDFRNASPLGEETLPLEQAPSTASSIQYLGPNLDDSDLYHFEITSPEIAAFLNATRGHDLLCRGDICRFSVDSRGAIDPVWDLR